MHPLFTYHVLILAVTGWRQSKSSTAVVSIHSFKAYLDNYDGFMTWTQPDAAADTASSEARWWKPQSFAASFAIACLAPIGWAVAGASTKAATANGVKHKHYFADFLLSIFLCAIFLLGLPGLRLHSSDDIASAHPSATVCAAVAGAIDAVGNLLMTMSIAKLGLTSSVSICMAIGLIVGAMATYVVDQRGRLEYILIALVLSLVAVFANTLAVNWNQQAARGVELQQHTNFNADVETSSSKEPIEERKSSPSVTDSAMEASREMEEPDIDTTPSVRHAFIGGVFIGAWAPLSAKSMEGPRSLNPYSSFVVFSIGFAVTGIALLHCQNMGLIGHVDGTSQMVPYTKISWSAHAYGVFAGIAWILAGQANCLGGKGIGFSVAFTVGQASPVITGMIGLLFYKDFIHSTKARILSAVSIALYISGVVVLAYSGE